jgi:hypothetical protein
VVGDKALVTPDDPGQVANAGGLASLKRQRDCEPRRVAESLRPGGPQLQLLKVGELVTDPLGLG